MTNKINKIILSGNWKNKTFWSFCLAGKLPKGAIATTSTVIVIRDNKVLLVNNIKRGWEIPAGHIEIGENTKQTAIRELKEEAGIKLKESDLKMVGYMLIENPDEGKENKATGKNYPKYAYNVFFLAHTNKNPGLCEDGSCDGAGYFHIGSDEVKNLRCFSEKML